jgi:hypothetical protein
MTSEALKTDGAAPTREPRPWVEWFWRAQALKEARRAVGEQSGVELSRLRHARTAAEVATRVLEGVDPLRAGPGYWVATLLYREAAYWALLSQSGALRAENLAAAFAESPRPLLLSAAGGDEGLANVQRILVEKQSAQQADEESEAQLTEAAIARTFVDALIQLKLRSTERVGGVLFERWVRTGAAVALAFGAVLAAVLFIRHLTAPTDLAEGKSWRVSSVEGAPCQPEENLCLNVRTDILFHTTQEKKPWFEVDLGTVASFSVVEVENRGDCCQDRAVPLVLEVSDDAQHWVEVARRKEVFDTWRAELSPQSARYVRARATRTTMLHLVRMSVYEK